MHKRLNTKQPGQSLPLLALMIVVIVAMVGLSVDVGNAYGQQRRAQNAANAAALSAMSSVIGNQTNQAVWDNVKRTLAANGVDTDSPNYTYNANYVFPNNTAQKPQLIGQWYQGAEKVPNATQTRPSNVIRVQVTLSYTMDTNFARVAGRETLTVNVNGNACPGGYGNGVLPIGVPVTPTKNYHQIYAPTNLSTPLSTTSAVWNQVAAGNWDRPSVENGPTMVGNVIKLPIQNEGGGTPSGTHVSWLNWAFANNANGNDALGKSLKYPGDLTVGFREGPVADSSLQSSTPNRQLELQDWVEGTTGVQNGNDVKGELDNLAARKQIVILPMYQASGKVNGKSTFYITKMGRFKIIEHKDTANPKYLMLQYFGDAPAGAEGCSSEANPDDTYIRDKRFAINGVANLNRVWRRNQPDTVSNDIVIVMDESASMAFDWYDNRNNVAEADKRITAAKTAIKTFVQGYDLQDDPEARMAFIEFSGSGGTRNQRARLMVDWQTACNAGQIASGCGSLGNKWKDIQQAADNLSPNGYTPGPFAFERAKEVLQSSPSTRPSGRAVRKILVFATDGVFNVCGSSPNTAACVTGQTVTCTSSNTEYCLNNADYNLVEPRPVWQGQQVAAQIKASGVSIFTIALKPDCPTNSTTCFDPKGLSDMSSGSGYHYQVSDANAMKSIYQLILAKIDNDQCVPKEQIEILPGATVRLSQPSNPSFNKSTTTDTEGKWEFRDLPDGQYRVSVDAVEKLSSEDGYRRLYTRVRNGLNLGEEGYASFTINPQWPDGSGVYGELLLSLPSDANGIPLNGCTTP
jgi:Flp pilus assembly protein TadG